VNFDKSFSRGLEVWLKVQCLLYKHEPLSSNSSCTKKKKFFLNHLKSFILYSLTTVKNNRFGEYYWRISMQIL
jgi:hypothetical protein